MVNDILIEGPLNNKTGILTIQFDRQIVINIPSSQAQQQVNHFVHMEISTQLHANTPILVVSQEEQQYWWRVPIHLTFPHFGDVGQVGSVNVNPQTGDMDTSLEVVKKLSQEADALASRFASPTAHTI